MGLKTIEKREKGSGTKERDGERICIEGQRERVRTKHLGLGDDGEKKKIN